MSVAPVGTLAAGLVVILSGGYLVGLGALSIVSPQRVARFLGAFASSAFAHFLEQCIRLVAGAAIVLYAPHMRFPGFFQAFGWVLVITSACLFVIPWRWHHRFAQQVIPQRTRNVRLYGIASAALGALVLFAAAPSMFR